jgi:hypothetical protein
MMAFLLISGGLVVNILPEAPPEGWSMPGHEVVEADGQIGWAWDGTTCAPVAPTSDEVNAERAARIERGTTVTVDGVAIKVQGRDEDTRNLQGIAFAAQLRIASGDTTTTIIFRDGDNVDRTLTPPQVLSLWSQAAAYVSLMYSKSWAIKALSPIPADFRNDAYWS